VRGVLQSVRATRSDDGQTGGERADERLNGTWWCLPTTNATTGRGWDELGCVWGCGMHAEALQPASRSPESDGPWCVMRGACSRHQATRSPHTSWECSAPSKFEIGRTRHLTTRKQGGEGGRQPWIHGMELRGRC
jgi:hypothetical protein